MKVLSNSKSTIIQINDDAIEVSNDKKSMNGRVFAYTLNEKRAKRNLLKGAEKENNLEVEIKSGNTNLRFSVGSYHEVLLPLLSSWSEEVGNTHYFCNNEMKIIEFEAGSDKSDKHVDTKLVIMFNNDRLTLHAYNSTQNLMVQGVNHEDFAVRVLEPYMRERINMSIASIDDINKKVIEAFEGQHFKKQKFSKTVHFVLSKFLQKQT